MKNSQKNNKRQWIVF